MTVPGWIDEVGAVDGPVLVIAEGLLMYLTEDEVRGVLQAIAGRFPGQQMLLEGISPFLLQGWGNRSPTVRSTGATFHWGLRRGADLSALVPGIEVLGEWFHAEVHPDRWRWLRLTRWITPVRRAMKVVHLRLPGPV